MIFEIEGATSYAFAEPAGNRVRVGAGNWCEDGASELTPDQARQLAKALNLIADRVEEPARAPFTGTPYDPGSEED